MIDDLTLARIRARADDPKTRTDNAEWLKGSPFPPASAASIAAAEKELGFGLPADLVTLYFTIANGGFGPGYGIMGVPGGFTDDRAKSIVSAYAEFRRTDPAYPLYVWPERLLPFCHWGCAIYSCIDCNLEDGPIMVWDPNNWEDRSHPSTAITEECASLAEWIAAWAHGVPLWDRLCHAVGLMVERRRSPTQ